VDHTFSRQSLGRRLDGISRTTGTPERAVYAIGTVITAGFGEEVIFRALLPATVYALTSNIAIALLLPLLLFALLHYDQGYRGILNAAVVGAAATVVFLVTQQLWWAIALHAIANLLATVIVPEVQRARVRRIVRRAIRGQLAASRPETT
jgi:membrane protease YdiL (CAAX protease family)